MKRLLFVILSFVALSAFAEDTIFVSRMLPDSIFQRMQGKSYPKNCTVNRSELRYLILSYRDANGKTRTGELVCNKKIAVDLVDIFRQLWKAKYCIGGMRLVDDYDADDQRSMQANNTSCFNFRFVSGTHTVSKHGRGMAIDINPLYNPYVYTRGGKQRVEPTGGVKYANNRSTRKDIPQKIDHNDLCYKLFRQHGFRWGGDWQHKKDYQHFEK